MIQFNLLPDVKLEFIKAQRTKHMVTVVAVAVTALALIVLGLLFFTVNIVQKQHIGNLDKDIQQDISYLKSVEDLDKVLTVQNQLNSLGEIHAQKPQASRLYEYLIQLTPSKASISNVTIDFATNTMTISGAANKLETVNKFVDTLKFSEYRTASESIKPFSGVVLNSFNVAGAETSENSVNYDITMTYNPIIFDGNTMNSGELKVPDIISTRSVTEKPSDLFQPKPKSTGEEE